MRNGPGTFARCPRYRRKETPDRHRGPNPNPPRPRQGPRAFPRTRSRPQAPPDLPIRPGNRPKANGRSRNQTGRSSRRGLHRPAGTQVLAMFLLGALTSPTALQTVAFELPSTIIQTQNELDGLSAEALTHGTTNT